jgi:hypothetical protein
MNMSPESTGQESDKVAEVARDAYICFFPMLMGYRFLFGGFLVPDLPSHKAPINTLSGEPETLDHTFRDVITPNADTPYSFAGLDLRAEPMVLSVPAIDDRFYHFQFEDLWGHNAHYVGTLATGSGSGTYLLAGPGWDGDAPADVDGVLRFETDIVFILGRTQLLGPDDVGTLSQIMAAYHLRPLSTHTGDPAPTAMPFDWPVWDDDASRDERFIGYVNALLPLCRPFHPEDRPMIERFAAIGIGAGEPFDADALDDAMREAIRTGVSEARAAMNTKIVQVGYKENGWVVAEIPGSRANYDGDHLYRAAAAMSGWGGNDTAEALYPTAREDADGQPLHGDHRYRITFASAPPVDAFWSLTIYDTSYDGTAGYLVDNPIDRYLVNSTTENLVRSDDGALTLCVQHDEPETPDDRANWLPAPTGPFYLTLRLYLPREAALDRSWEPPPVERIDS